MKKFLFSMAIALLMAGTTSCQQDGSTTASSSPKATANNTIDSLSMVFGDIWGDAISKMLIQKDSTVNLEQSYKEIEQVLGVDSANARIAMQIVNLFDGAEKQLGKPLNKELFMQQLSQRMISGPKLTDADIKAMQESIEPLMERIAPGSTHQEPTSFTTSKGTYSISGAMQNAYDQAVSTASGRRGLHDKNPSLFKKSGAKAIEADFKSWWMAYYGMPSDDLARDVYQRALKQYKKGFEDGWNY